MQKSLLDPSFIYTPSASTDLKKTFRRLRKEIREKEERERAQLKNVSIISRVKKEK